VIRLMLPRVAGLGVFSINFIVMNNIASRLGTGSVSALDWGWRLMQIPQTLIGTAMGTVIFPTLAALSELGDGDGKRRAMSGALRFIMVATIPSAVGLVMVGRPVISLLERDAFDASASALVYSTLQFFALGLIVHSALEVVARSFYADQDTLTPLYAALGGAAINVVGSLLFSQVARVESDLFYNRIIAPQVGFLADTGNVGGLALANSLGVMFEVSFLLVILRRRWHGIHGDALGRATLQATIASLIMAGAIAVVDLGWGTVGLDTGRLIMTAAQIAVETGVGAAVFILAALALGMEELRMLYRLIKREEKPAIAL
jgi:putative peptidoglycan lipid II flippase